VFFRKPQVRFNSKAIYTDCECRALAKKVQCSAPFFLHSFHARPSEIFPEIKAVEPLTRTGAFRKFGSLLTSTGEPGETPPVRVISEYLATFLEFMCKSLHSPAPKSLP
jgi:hypothetical protein